ncbi:hypothetical protein Tco_0039041 [Tanacetum coccineum]
MYQRLARHLASVQSFLDPILFLAGLKTSWEHSSKHHAIFIGGKEMAFWNFMFAEDDEEMIFIPHEPSPGFGFGSPSPSINNEPPLLEAEPLASVNLEQLLLRTLKNGSDLSKPFERNRLSVASFLLRLCISLSVLGGLRSVIVLTFEGLALIPCLVMRCPKNGPSLTPKENFFGLSFILMDRSLSKVSWISISMSYSEALLITMSST